jgi:hypothetical protein
MTTVQDLFKIWRIKNKDRLPILELHKLEPQGQDISQTNVVIAISGFMSKNTDKMAEWSQIVNYFKD